MDTNIPFVELTIKYKGKYLAAVLTDDEDYYNDISIKASHVYKPFGLKQKNWIFNEVFSRQYWSDPEQIKERINRMIARNIEEE